MIKENITEGLFTEKEVAKMLNLSIDTIRNRRSQKKPPKYIKLGGRVFYRKEDIDDFLKTYIKEIS